jgi:hypothetical protein
MIDLGFPVKILVDKLTIHFLEEFPTQAALLSPFEIEQFRFMVDKLVWRSLMEIEEDLIIKKEN